MSKKCSACGLFLEASFFVKDNRKKGGIGARCKKCHRVVCADYISRNHEKRIATTKAYYSNNKETCKQRQVEWNKRNAKAVSEYQQRYRDENKDKLRQGAKDYTKRNGRKNMLAQRAKYPERYRARYAVSNAIANSRLASASSFPCAQCGKAAQEYHHHAGYAKENALIVTPLCVKCHRNLK